MRRVSRLIQPGRRIQIQLESGFETIDYSSRVRFIGTDEETGRESIMLELPTGEDGRLLDFDEGEEITLYEETDGGEPRTYQTKVIHPARVEEELEEEGYVLIVEMTAPPMQQRNFAREDAALPITFLLLDKNGKQKEKYEASSSNLGAGGILLTVDLDSPDEVAIGDTVGVQFQLPDEYSAVRRGRKAPFELYATIVRKYLRLHAGREVPNIGIKFDNIKPDEQDKLMGYILSLQRQRAGRETNR